MNSDSVPVAEKVQTFGRKKNAVAVALVKTGKGVMRVNGQPINLFGAKTLQLKLAEPMLVVGQERFAKLDVRVWIFY